MDIIHTYCHFRREYHLAFPGQSAGLLNFSFSVISQLFWRNLAEAKRSKVGFFFCSHFNIYLKNEGCTKRYQKEMVLFKRMSGKKGGPHNAILKKSQEVFASFKILLRSAQKNVYKTKYIIILSCQ